MAWKWVQNLLNKTVSGCQVHEKASARWTAIKIEENYALMNGVLRRRVGSPVHQKVVSIDVITLLISLVPYSSSTRLLFIGTSKRSSHTKCTVIHSAHMSNRSLSVPGYNIAAAKQKTLALLHFPGALFWYLDSVVS